MVCDYRNIIVNNEDVTVDLDSVWVDGGLNYENVTQTETKDKDEIEETIREREGRDKKDDGTFIEICKIR